MQIADKDVARIRALSGTTFPATQTNEVATKDAIRHFAEGIGDPNPLWRDERFSCGTPYRCLIAPQHSSMPFSQHCGIKISQVYPGLMPVRLAAVHNYQSERYFSGNQYI